MVPGSCLKSLSGGGTRPGTDMRDQRRSLRPATAASSVMCSWSATCAISSRVRLHMSSMSSSVIISPPRPGPGPIGFGCFNRGIIAPGPPVGVVSGQGRRAGATRVIGVSRASHGAIPLKNAFATAEIVPLRRPFSTWRPTLCKSITNASHQPRAHRLAHSSLNRKFSCCTASDLPEHRVEGNVSLPQRSRGSGGVREAFLRRSAGRTGTCTRDEPNGPQDRLRTQAEPSGSRGERRRKRADRTIPRLATADGSGVVPARVRSHRVGEYGAIRIVRFREGVRRCADRVQAPGAFFRLEKCQTKNGAWCAPGPRLTYQAMHPRPSTVCRIPRRISVWQPDIA